MSLINKKGLKPKKKVFQPASGCAQRLKAGPNTQQCSRNSKNVSSLFTFLISRHEPRQQLCVTRRLTSTVSVTQVDASSCIRSDRHAVARHAVTLSTFRSKRGKYSGQGCSSAERRKMAARKKVGQTAACAAAKNSLVLYHFIFNI